MKRIPGCNIFPLDTVVFYITQIGYWYQDKALKMAELSEMLKFYQQVLK